MADAGFSLKLKSIPIDIEDEAGRVHKFTLKELTGEQRDNYLNTIRDKSTVVDGKMQGVKDFRGLHTDLLSVSLYDEQDKLVGEKVLKLYPASILSELFKMARVLSGLGGRKESEEEAKNE